MNLLEKLNFRYIVFSLIVMVISGIAIYFILSIVFARQTDEHLIFNLQRVESQLAVSPQTGYFEPFSRIVEAGNMPEGTAFSDTIIYNVLEDEYEEYRQVDAVKKIGSRNYRIIIRKSKIESEDLQGTLALVTFVAMLLLTTTLIFVNRRVAKSIWKPFYNNLKIIEQFSTNEKKPILLEKTGITEFEKLNQSITRLTVQIIKDFQNQKQLSEDISHELQTPLAIVSSRLEALLNDSSLSHAHAEAISSIYTSIRRLSRLNKALVLLGKIENNQFVQSGPVSLKNMIKEKLEEFSELIRLKSLTVKTSFVDDFIFAADPALADILINNLISNSINHSQEGGTIDIKILGGKLVFCNSGVNEIPEPEKLFNRFYKADPSLGSAGLGLAIVKKICDMQNISIQYGYSGSFHCFTLYRQL